MCKARRCNDCQTDISALDMRAEFCGTPCRLKWHNRRMQRGAELYDLFMACRYDRGLAKALGLWALVCRMASYWNDEDKAAGRRSYFKPEVAKDKALRYQGIRGHL